MELQHRQQSQDHQGWCSHNLSVCNIASSLSHTHKNTLLTPLPHVHSLQGETQHQVTHFYMFMWILPLLPTVLSPFPSLHSIWFQTQFIPLYRLILPILDLTSESPKKAPKNRANRNKKNSTRASPCMHVHAHRHAKNITIPFILTCPAYRCLTGIWLAAKKPQQADTPEW